MRLTLPTIVYRTTGHNGVHTVAPLFSHRDAVSKKQLSSATSGLAKELREKIREFAVAGLHERIWRYIYDPNPSLHRLTLQPELKKQYVKLQVPIVSFRSLGRRYAFCPMLRQLWFDVERGEDLTTRANEVITHLIRERDKENADNTWIDFFKTKRRYWLASLDVEVSMTRPIEKKEPTQELMELFGQPGPADGAREIYRVGRCLEDMYPDGLQRAFLRQAAVDQLNAWSTSGNRRPLLLVGEPMVGKTTIIHEWVRQRVQNRRKAFGGKKQTFLISPQRLISGMSFVGQWEERWNKILQTARKKSHVLYFDDLLGLFAAGKSASSNLSAAHVLKGFVERRDVFVIAEMTPSELRVFREKDRGFADMFEIVKIEESSFDESLNVLVRQVGELESKHSCRFEPSVIPSVMELSRHFSTRGVFPGAPAAAMQQLATQNEHRKIDYSTALDFYARCTGLEQKLVDSRKTLKRTEITDFFESNLIGQPQAIDAIADVVSVTKAQLGDGKRPLGTLLFAGPTGVGKTEAAKLLAQYLFDDVDRLVRFDLNEFVQPGSAQRLIGTFDRPDGLLTNAVRQQPFNVLLLDEIEKAHPEVFDLLLQVLGEGRLTDARGRTVDFSKSIVIMTSNVGADKDASSIGFVESEQSAEQRFMQAIRSFWRPEFFNRIDRIVPFRRLSRDDLAKIADILLNRLLKREGFSRRPVTVMGDLDALEWVVDQGYSEQLGGRAMRRAVERELVGPVANAMAGMLPNERAIIRMRKNGGNLQTTVLPLELASPNAVPDPQFQDVSVDFFAAVDRYLDAALERCKRLPGADGFENHTHPLAFERIATIDFLRRLQAKAEAIADYECEVRAPRSVVRSPRKPADDSAKVRGKRPSYRTPVSSPLRRHHKDLHAFQDIDDYLYERDSYGSTKEINDVEIQDIHLAFDALIHDLKQLPLIVPEEDWKYQRVVLLVRTFNREGSMNRSMVAESLKAIGTSRIDEGMDQATQDVEQGLRIQRITRRSVWEKKIREAIERTRNKANAAKLRALQQLENVVADEVLTDSIDGAVVSGNNAFAWLTPLVGTHLTKLILRSVPLQVIVREIADGQTCEETIAAVMDEHRRYENAQMNDPRDPFWLRPVGLDLFGNNVTKVSREFTDYISGSLPLPRELQATIPRDHSAPSVQEPD